MSFTKMDSVFTNAGQEIIARAIATVLREEYSGVGSAIKRIAKKIDAEPRAVKNWYEGRRAPNLRHFIALARTSSKMTACFLQLAGYGDLVDTLAHLPSSAQEGKKCFVRTFYYINFDTFESAPRVHDLQALNQRQLWFYHEISKGRKLDAQNITAFWHVGVASARRDIAKLIALNLICFVGSKRNGFYVLQ